MGSRQSSDDESYRKFTRAIWVSYDTEEIMSGSRIYDYTVIDSNTRKMYDLFMVLHDEELAEFSQKFQEFINTYSL